MVGSEERNRIERICYLSKQQVRVKAKTMPGEQLSQLGGSSATLANREHGRKSSLWKMVSFVLTVYYLRCL